jgi:hypothetical protein
MDLQLSLSKSDKWERAIMGKFPLTNVPRSREPPNRASIMKIERLAGHHEARDALVLAVAGVTSIMLIANLILMIWH